MVSIIRTVRIGRSWAACFTLGVSHVVLGIPWLEYSWRVLCGFFHQVYIGIISAAIDNASDSAVSSELLGKVTRQYNKIKELHMYVHGSCHAPVWSTPDI
jgi:hypothetical protein